MARKVHRNTSLGLPHNMKLLDEKKYAKNMSSGCSCFWGLPSFNVCYSNLIQCMELYLTDTCLTTICIFKISCKTILDKISLVKN